MIRATTPIHTFNFDVPASDFERILITYNQCGVNILNLEKTDLQIEGNTAFIQLTEEQTKTFKAGSPVYIQVRVVLNGSSMASTIVRADVKEVLNDINLI